MPEANSKRFPWLAPLAISLRETGNSCSPQQALLPKSIFTLCTFRCWWAAFLESLSAVGLYFRLSACFLCLSKLAPHLSVLVGLSGLEPPTSRLSGVRSNRLSYKPISWFERWFPTLPGPAASYPPVGPPAFFFRRAPFPNCPPQVWWR